MRLNILLLNSIFLVQRGFSCTDFDVKDPFEWPCEAAHGICGCPNSCNSFVGNALDYSKCSSQNNKQIACCAPYVSCSSDLNEQATQLVHLNVPECQDSGNDTGFLILIFIISNVNIFALKSKMTFALEVRLLVILKCVQTSELL